MERGLSSLIDDQNFLESDRGLLKYACLLVCFSYFAHYGIVKSFVLGQPLYRFGDLELVIAALTPFDIMADIMINPGGIRPDGGSFRGYAFPHGREKVLGPTRPDLLTLYHLQYTENHSITLGPQRIQVFGSTDDEKRQYLTGCTSTSNNRYLHFLA